MPDCGSQIAICDVPIRYDTYKGCGHVCSYCFVSRKANIREIEKGESPQALKEFIKGKRSPSTKWCDWDIPLHWGGVSDPFQPIEKVEKRSLKALEVFAETQYPFIVSTKNKLIATEPYLSLIKQCNCVVQFSAVSPQYDALERGASTYAERLAAAEKITPYKRVNLRAQPYIPAVFKDTIKAARTYRDIGIHGVIFEAMKYTKPVIPELTKIGGDYCYSVEQLMPQFTAIRDCFHRYGLKFYSGENRLRSLSDELCCCGVEGLGWRVNTANQNHYLFDPQGVEFSERMKEQGTAQVWGACEQSTVQQAELKLTSYAEKMAKCFMNPYQYQIGGVTFTKEQSERLRTYLKACLKASGRKAAEVDKHLGTSGMAGHYFGASQWSMPTREAYEKMRQIIPQLGDYDYVLSEIGGKSSQFKAYSVVGRIR